MSTVPTDVIIPDPLAEIEQGDNDPIGPFDPDNICGASVLTYPGENNRVECLREPHPLHWLHVSACDDAVDYVWRDVRPDEIAGWVVTDEGVRCRSCGLDVTTHAVEGGHYAGCAVLRDTAQEGSTGDC